MRIRDQKPDQTEPYLVRVAPRASDQLNGFSPLVAAVLNARLNRMATRARKPDDQGVVQGHLVGRTFRALYEVDHEQGVVTVLDVTPWP